MAVPDESLPAGPAKKVSARKLTLKQQAFVEHYADPDKKSFGNARQSYALSHPRSTSALAQRVSGHQTLTNANVMHAVRERLNREGVDLEAEFAWGIEEAKAKGKLTDHNAYCVNLAKLSGVWKERSEVEQVSNETKDLIRRSVAEKLTHPN